MSDTPTSVMHAMVGAIMAKNMKGREEDGCYWETVTEVDNSGVWVRTRKEREWAFKIWVSHGSVYVHFPPGLLDADFDVEPGGPEFREGRRARRVWVSKSKLLVVLMQLDGGCFHVLSPSNYLDSEGVRKTFLYAMLLAQARLLLKLGV